MELYILFDSNNNGNIKGIFAFANQKLWRAFELILTFIDFNYQRQENYKGKSKIESGKRAFPEKRAGILKIRTTAIGIISSSVAIL